MQQSHKQRFGAKSACRIGTTFCSALCFCIHGRPCRTAHRLLGRLSLPSVTSTATTTGIRPRADALLGGRGSGGPRLGVAPSKVTAPERGGHPLALVRQRAGSRLDLVEPQRGGEDRREGGRGGRPARARVPEVLRFPGIAGRAGGGGGGAAPGGGHGEGGGAEELVALLGGLGFGLLLVGSGGGGGTKTC